MKVAECSCRASSVCSATICSISSTSYGTRLLEPFSHRWFYGDTLFIMDPWIWLVLILGLEMSWRAERLGKNWTRPAIWAFAAMLGYIGAQCRDRLAQSR